MKKSVRHGFLASVAVAIAFMGYGLVSCAGNAANYNKMVRGETVRQSKLEYFKAVETTGVFDVYFTQCNRSYIRIVSNEANDSEVENIKAKVVDGVLRISTKGGDFNMFKRNKSKEIKIYIGSPDLVGVNTTGSGDFVVLNALDTDTLRVSQSGVGDMKFDKPLVCDRLELTVRGTGDAELKQATAASASFELYGVGDIDANLANAAHTDVLLKGTGDVDINFTNCGTASATLYGVGDIALKGSLRSLTKKKYGTGDIDCSELHVLGSTGAEK